MDKKKLNDIIEKSKLLSPFEIKDELIDGDKATVLVEIEVIDYKKAVDESHALL